MRREMKKDYFKRKEVGMKKKPVSKRDKTLNMIKYTDIKIIKEDFKKSKSSYSETEKSS